MTRALSLDTELNRAVSLIKQQLDAQLDAQHKLLYRDVKADIQKYIIKHISHAAVTQHVPQLVTAQSEHRVF